MKLHFLAPKVTDNQDDEVPLSAKFENEPIHFLDKENIETSDSEESSLSSQNSELQKLLSKREEQLKMLIAAQEKLPLLAEENLRLKNLFKLKTQEAEKKFVGDGVITYQFSILKQRIADLENEKGELMAQIFILEDRTKNQESELAKFQQIQLECLSQKQKCDQLAKSTQNYLENTLKNAPRLEAWNSYENIMLKKANDYQLGNIENVRKLETEVAQSRQKLQQHQLNEVMLFIEIERLHSVQSNFIKELTDLSEQIEKLKQENASLKFPSLIGSSVETKENETLLHNIKELQIMNKRLFEDNQKLCEITAQQEKDLQLLKKVSGDSTFDKPNITVTIESIIKLETKIKMQENEVKNLKKTNETLHQNNHQLKQKLDLLQNECNNLRTSISSGKIIELETELTILREKYNNIVMSEKNKLKDYESNSSEQTEKINDYETDIASSQSIQSIETLLPQLRNSFE